MRITVPLGLGHGVTKTLSHRRVVASWKLGWCRKHRNLDVRIAGLHGHRRASRPSHLQGKMIEHHAGPAFEDETIGSHTTKKNAVLWCVEGKEIRTPHQIGPGVILRFEHFAVRSEKARRIGIVSQTYSKNQKRTFVLLVFK